jgi:hypothetical protein
MINSDWLSQPHVSATFRLKDAEMISQSLVIKVVGFLMFSTNVRRSGSRTRGNNNNNGDRSTLVTTSKPSLYNGADRVTVNMFSVCMPVTDRLRGLRQKKLLVMWTYFVSKVDVVHLPPCYSTKPKYLCCCSFFATPFSYCTTVSFITFDVFIANQRQLFCQNWDLPSRPLPNREFPAFWNSRTRSSFPHPIWKDLRSQIGFTEFLCY